MSEKKIKNPLFQPIASFTVDDFTHNAIIMAPAPELKPVTAIFTPNQGALIAEDPATFSEVSLDAKSESLNTPASYSPLEGLDSTTDLASLAEQAPNQSLTSGLTSSFAQLPNVASTVFSTFSRVIKGDSPAPETAPPPEQQNFYQLQNSVPQTYQEPVGASQEALPPPTFFSPNDPALPSLSSPPSVNTGANTFRLGGSKKKTYAGIPGLSTSTAAPILELVRPTSFPQAPPPEQNLYEPQPPSQASYFDLNRQPEAPSAVPAPEAPSKFSFSSLLGKVPSVKDFAQNIKDVVAPDLTPSTTSYIDPSSATPEIRFDQAPSQHLFAQQAPPPQPVQFSFAPFTPASEAPSAAPPPQPVQFNFAPSEAPPSSEAPPLQPVQFSFVPFGQDPAPGPTKRTSEASPSIESTPEVAPPPFFSPAAVPSIPKGPPVAKPGANPYSNSRFGKSAVYKNPALIPSTQVQPSNLLQSQAPPPTTASFFTPVQQPVAQAPPTFEAVPPYIAQPSELLQSQAPPPTTTSFFSPVVQPSAPPTSAPAAPQTGAFFTSEVTPSFPPQPVPAIASPAEVAPPPNSVFKPIESVDSSEPPKAQEVAPEPPAVQLFTPAQNQEVPRETQVAPPPINSFFQPPPKATSPQPPSQEPPRSSAPPQKPPTSEFAAFNPFQRQPKQPKAAAQAGPAFQIFNPVEAFSPEQSVSAFSAFQQAPKDSFSDLPKSYPPPLESVAQEAQEQPQVPFAGFPPQVSAPNQPASFFEAPQQEAPQQNLAALFQKPLPTEQPSVPQKASQEPQTPQAFFNNFSQNDNKPEPETVPLFSSYNNNNINTSSQVDEATRDPQNNVISTEPDTQLPRFTPVNFFIDSPQSVTPAHQQTQQNQFSNFFDQPPEQNSLNFYNKAEQDITQTIDSYSSFRSESASELNQDIDYDEIPEEMTDELDSGKISTNEVKYRPVYYHWFYQTKQEGGLSSWTPFSMNDSMSLEEAFQGSSSQVVHTDGGRFDVNIGERLRRPVYWKGEPNEVRRCSWFYKALDSKFVPYEELTADKLEEEFKVAAMSGEWHKKIPLSNGETVVFHGPTVIVHFLQSQNPDSWGSTAQPTNRPRVVKRGIDEFSIEDGEPEQIDHLLFMVHGIGKACDLKFRTIEEAVDEYRNIALQLVQSHYRTSCDLGAVGRVEVLPISWHAELHSEEIGIDDKIKQITLESIPKLRTFANETLLDILFYSSPIFCQQIMDFVGHSMNRLFNTFRQRNPRFRGQVSVGGHSLGSLILFDLLCHQKEPDDQGNLENPDSASPVSVPRPQPANYTMGPAGTGQPFITYPQLIFRPKKFFALGSPISMFVTVRGIDKLGLDFRLPTCEGFYNIFHPFDPVAYRCEPLINPELSSVRPVVISHHKGRKRMHLELKETMTRVSADIKQRVLCTFRNTVQAMYPFKNPFAKPDQQAIDYEVNKALEEHELKLGDEDEGRKRSDSVSTTTVGSDGDPGETDLPLGVLNNGHRVDFVLQEAPLEFFNEYLFALTSHVCYWESEDTILFMMKEIYSSMGIQTDGQIPQHTMTIERPSSSKN